MKLTGNTAHFAIEYKASDQNLPFNISPRGFARIWVRNQSFGDFPYESYFSHIYLGMQDIFKRLEKLSKPIGGLTPTDVFNYILRAKATVESSDVDRYFVNLGDAFDGYVVVCYTEKEDLVFIWEAIEQSHPNNFQHDLYFGKVNLEYCKRVVKQFQVEVGIAQ